MRRIFAVLLCLIMLLLCACGSSDVPSETTDLTTSETTTEIVTTTEAPTTIPRTPNDPLAFMEPEQGGLMLYTFQGKKSHKTRRGHYEDEVYLMYPIGLINQDGKLVCAPKYDDVIYLEDTNKRIVGLVASVEGSYTLYRLDGTSEKLICEGGYINPNFHDSRYLVMSYGYRYEPPCDGLFDLDENRWILEPQEGQSISHNYAAGDMLKSIYRYDADNELVAQWFFDFTDGTLQPLRIDKGRIGIYLPETGWYGIVIGSEEYTYYDKDWNLLPALEGYWLQGFYGMKYCTTYKARPTPYYTLVTREGKVEDIRFEGNRFENIDVGQNCILAHWIDPGKDWRDRRDALYDINLNLVCYAEPGERLLWLGSGNVADVVIIHFDVNRKIKAAYDYSAKPLQPSPAFRYWTDRAPYFEATMLYTVQNGKWQIINVEHLTGSYSDIREMNENYFIAQISHCEHEDDVPCRLGDHTEEYFAFDWNSKPYQGEFEIPRYSNFKGWDGAEYYWEEQPNKRGYIDQDGNWLFIDKTGK